MANQQSPHHVGGQPNSGNHREDTVPGGCGSRQENPRR